MAFEDLYIQLEESRRPVDLHDEPDAEANANEFVYRRGWSSVAVPGLPDWIQVGDVEVHRAVGPVRTQRTAIRQRHGLPVVFDKSLELGAEVAQNEVLTVFQIRGGYSGELDVASMRERAEAACGVLAAMVDDRIAVEPRFEDVILLADGKPVSSADSAVRVRTFLPFDVTGNDADLLPGLAGLDLASAPNLEQAARWYRRGSEAGPTADAIIYFWVAIEALTPSPSTSPKMVEAMLLDAGFAPDWAGDLTVGRMAGLRAEIVHSGQREHELIVPAYYRLELICRVLIRRAVGIYPEWPPALTSGSFGEAAEDVERQLRDRQTVWHTDGLPPPDEPAPAGIPWISLDEPTPELPIEVELGGTIPPGNERRLWHWIAEAIEFVGDVAGPVTVEVDADDLPDGVEMRVNPPRIVLHPDLLARSDPVRELHLARMIHTAFGELAVMEQNITFESLGATLIRLAGAWAGWRFFFQSGDDLAEVADAIEIAEPAAGDLAQVGVAVGIAIAGGSPGAAALVAWSQKVNPDMAKIFQILVADWAPIETFDELLRAIVEFADSVRGGGSTP